MYGNASFVTSTSVTAAKDLARLRPPQAEGEERAGALGDRDALAVADLRAQPREVVLTRTATGDDAEQVLAFPRDREVEPDPAAGRERRRVDERADRSVDPVREHPLEERERARPLDVELRERGDVEQRDVGARREVLGALDRRPELRGPGVAPAPRGVRGHQAGVGLEPLRAFPSRAGDELRAELGVPRVERGQTELAGSGHLLARMDDVVDLAVLLLPALEDVRRRRWHTGRSGSRRPRRGRTRVRRAPSTPPPAAPYRRRGSPTRPRRPRSRAPWRTRRRSNRRPA